MGLDRIDRRVLECIIEKYDGGPVGVDTIAAGIRGIWNFAPVKLSVPDAVPLVSEDLSVGLSSLSYSLIHTEAESEELSEKNNIE